MTALKSPKSQETPVTPKTLDRAVHMAAEVAAMRSEFDGAIGHQVGQSPFLELCQVCWRCGGAINDEPVAHRTEVGSHLS